MLQRLYKEKQERQRKDEERARELEKLRHEQACVWTYVWTRVRT